MKRIITGLLIVAMVVSMIPIFGIASAAAAPTITVDGSLNDWANVKTIQVKGTGDNDGKAATFYAVITAEGLYLACDAYHALYKTTEGNWWENTNFEIFVGVNANKQFYISAKGITAEHPSPTKQGDVLEAAMVTTDVTGKGAAKYHSTAEMFIPRAALPAEVETDNARVGVAWKTPGDYLSNGDCGNGDGNGDKEWWTPVGTRTSNGNNDHFANQCIVTAEGIYLPETYRQEVGKASEIFSIKSEWSYTTATANAAPAAPEGFPNSIASTMKQGNAPFGNRADGATNNWGTTADKGDGTQDKAYLWVAKEFTIDDINSLKGKTLLTNMYFDDDIKLYINGTLVFSNTGWNDGYTIYKLAEKAEDVLKSGKNVIAASLHQHTGGYEFDMSLKTEDPNALTDPLFPVHAYVGTEQELKDYIAAVNMGVRTTRLTTLTITKDIKVTGDWTPITVNYTGTINGNNKTISGITYVTDATSGDFGLIANKFGNDNNEKGTAKDLILKDCVIIAKSTSGCVGGIVGYVDRGRAYNCTVDNVTVIGNTFAGGVVGGAAYASDKVNDVDIIKLEDNTVKNTTVVAVGTDGVAGGIVGKEEGDNKASLGNYVVNDVTLQGKTTGAAVGKEQVESIVGDNANKTDVDTSATVKTASAAEATKAWDNSKDTTLAIGIKDVNNASVVTAVKVGGKAIKASNYTIEATETGINIVLKASYMKTLKTGEYKVSVETYAGNVDVTVNVTNVESVAPTGDIALAVAFIASISLLALAAVVVTKKRSLVK